MLHAPYHLPSHFIYRSYPGRLHRAPRYHVVFITRWPSGRNPSPKLPFPASLELFQARKVGRTEYTLVRETVRRLCWSSKGLDISLLPYDGGNDNARQYLRYRKPILIAPAVRVGVSAAALRPPAGAQSEAEAS